MDDRLISRLKRRAAEQGTSVSKLIEQAVRLFVRSPRTPEAPQAFELVTFAECERIQVADDDVWDQAQSAAVVRAAVGGGEAIIPSNVKVAAPGTPIDVPLGHKDNVWSFDHFDTMTVMVPDAPRPDEIVMVVAIADGGRPHPRVGQSRATI